MKGTEKQIAWAEDIRRGAYNVLDWIEDRHAHDRFYNTTDMMYVSPEAVKALRAEFDAVFATIDSAAVIIDRREIFSRDWIIKHGRDWMRHNGQPVVG